MIRNYIKVAFRNLARNKVYTFINILGLSVGLTCTLLILLWVQDELSVDTYHEKGNNIAQTYLKGIRDEDASYQTTVSPVIGTILKDEYPEVVDAVRMGSLEELVLKYEDKKIVESTGFASDPSVFSIFSYELIEGDPDTALDDPHSIVLTESTAKKYFGDENPVGKVIIIDNTYEFKVTGIIQDLPANAYRKFNFLVPFEFLKEKGYDIIGTPFYPCNYITYVLLKDNTNIQNLSEKVSKRIFIKGEEISFEICLIPFTEVYSFDNDGGKRNTILIFIALFILGIACVNFTNLSTAQSIIRAKEIGVRKVTGASRLEIAKQFLSEGIFLTFIAAILAIILVESGISYFNQVTGKSLTIQFNNLSFVASFIGLILVTGVLAGIYPAIYISRFHPAHVIKNSMGNKANSAFRHSLIVFQFILSTFFIICTIVLSKQADYIRNFNWGLNRDNIVYVRMDGDIIEKYDAVKQELLKKSYISSVTSASNLPVSVRSGSYLNWGINDEVGRRICPISVEYDFLKTFNIKMKEGRFYSQEFSGDVNQAIIVNETAIRKIGQKDPIGKPFYFDDKYFTLIGIIKDFQHNSPLRLGTEPLVFWLKPDGNQYLFVKIDPAVTDISIISETVEYIQNVCNQFSPEKPLSAQFLSEFSFQDERNLETSNKLIVFSTILMIFVACLGLFGLSAFVNERKTKEIGVRKVLGASVLGLVFILSKEFCKWVLLANIIAWPLAYYAMTTWLEDFAFKVELNLWFFIFSGAFALLIALLTVSYQAIKSALTNPVDSLKYE